MKTFHAKQLVAALRTCWMTYGDMLDLKISQCPWKRLSESAHLWLKPGEVIDRKKNGDGLLMFKVVRATKWTA